jgi:glycosyltransferase involved in cell wall biosynthesis
VARIRILHADLSEIGGAELLLAEQARWFITEGHDVRVVALRGTGAAWREAMAGVPVQVVADPPKIERLHTPAAMAPLVLAARPALADADAVLAHNFPAAPIAALASPPGARRVWYCHEPYRALYPEATFPASAARAAVGSSAGEFTDAPTRQWARRARRRWWLSRVVPGWAAQRRALAAWDATHVAMLDAVVANSPASAAMLYAALGRQADAIVPPAIHFGAPLGAKPAVSRDAPQLLAQTRLGVPKNLDVLLEAVGAMRAAFPGVHLHVAGDGPQRAHLEALAARVAPGLVTFHGHVSRAAADALAARCDIFVLVPVDEPFGMVFPEAAARGLLVVGPNHGGPASILEGIGETCDAFSPQAVCDAIVRVLHLDDAAIASRRAAADTAVRARYAPSVVFPALTRIVLGEAVPPLAGSRPTG